MVSTGLFDGSGFGTDMGRYFYNYDNLGGMGDFRTFSDLFSGALKDPINYAIQYGFKLLGFSFYAFLLFVTFSFYKGATYRLNILFGKKNNYITNIYRFILHSISKDFSLHGFLRHSIALAVVLFSVFKLLMRK